MKPRRPTRLVVFLVTTFAISWSCWWTLAALASSGAASLVLPGSIPTLTADQRLFVRLFIIGGWGPTIAAYLAILATPGEGRVREFHSRLFKWRVGVRWYLAALGVPVALGVSVVLVVQAIRPSVLGGLAILPWYRAFLWFPIMIVGGGNEELGWRGIAQHALEQRASRVIAAQVVGLIWGVWHLPLWSVPGAPQSETSFSIFLVDIVRMSLILAWLYGSTQSILMCVFFHAAVNAMSQLGFPEPHELGGVLGAAIALLELIAGLGLVLATKSGEPCRSPKHLRVHRRDILPGL